MVRSGVGRNLSSERAVVARGGFQRQQTTHLYEPMHFEQRATLTEPSWPTPRSFGSTRKVLKHTGGVVTRGGKRAITIRPSQITRRPSGLTQIMSTPSTTGPTPTSRGAIQTRQSLTTRKRSGSTQTSPRHTVIEDSFMKRRAISAKPLPTLTKQFASIQIGDCIQQPRFCLWENRRPRQSPRRLR